MKNTTILTTIIALCLLNVILNVADHYREPGREEAMEQKASDELMASFNMYRKASEQTADQSDWLLPRLESSTRELEQLLNINSPNAPEKEEKLCQPYKEGNVKMYEDKTIGLVRASMNMSAIGLVYRNQSTAKKIKALEQRLKRISEALADKRP